MDCFPREGWHSAEAQDFETRCDRRDEPDTDFETDQPQKLKAEVNRFRIDRVRQAVGNCVAFAYARYPDPWWNGQAFSFQHFFNTA